MDEFRKEVIRSGVKRRPADAIKNDVTAPTDVDLTPQEIADHPQEILKSTQNCREGGTPTQLPRNDFPNEGEDQRAAYERTEDPYMFRLEGKRWVVAFAGKTRTYHDTFGFSYIHLLLQRQGEGIGVAELEDSIRGGLTAPGETRAGGGAEPSTQESKAPQRPLYGRGAEVMDNRARSEVKNWLSQLAEDIAAARKRGDHTKAEELEDQATSIASCLRKTMGLFGRSRRMSDELDASRKRVYEAIATACRAIKEEQPEFYAHLQESIPRLGFTPMYRPIHSYPWKL